MNFISEDRIVYNQAINNEYSQISDEVQNFRANELESLMKNFQCGICFNLLTMDSKPLSCKQCKNAFYCTECSYKQDYKCGYCQERNLVSQNQKSQIFQLISQFRVKCQYFEKGCQQIFNGDGYDIQIHENFDCKYKEKKNYEIKNECRLCSQVKNNNDSKSIHFCNKDYHNTLCENHLSQENYLFTRDRISLKLIQKDDISQMNAKFLNNVLNSQKCKICDNFLKDEKTCLFCFTKYCEFCIANRMNTISNLCIQCGCEFQADKYFSKYENLLFLLQFYQIEIKCRNSNKKFGECEYSIKLECNQDLKYKFEDLQIHESSCHKCQKCKQYCNYCYIFIQNKDYEKHYQKCKQKYNPPVNYDYHHQEYIVVQNKYCCWRQKQYYQNQLLYVYPIDNRFKTYITITILDLLLQYFFVFQIVLKFIRMDNQIYIQQYKYYFIVMISLFYSPFILLVSGSTFIQIYDYPKYFFGTLFIRYPLSLLQILDIIQVLDAGKCLHDYSYGYNFKNNLIKQKILKNLFQISTSLIFIIFESIFCKNSYIIENIQEQGWWILKQNDWLEISFIVTLSVIFVFNFVIIIIFERLI